jgi:hypothetical protein
MLIGRSPAAPAQAEEVIVEERFAFVLLCSAFRVGSGDLRRDVLLVGQARPDIFP